MMVFCIKTEAADELVPRKIIALYQKSKYIPTLYYSPIHKYAEMPLNYLGLSADYYNIEEGLPSLKDRKDIAGILIWFEQGTVIKDFVGYLKWLKEALDSNLKVVIIGDGGILESSLLDRPRESNLTEYIMSKLGLAFNYELITETYNYRIVSLDNELTSFERNYPQVKPPFQMLFNKNDSTLPILEALNRDDDEAYPVIISSINPNGAYIDDEYAINNIGNEEDHPDSLQWYINPFKFFCRAFDVENQPRPDVTTIAGRRILFSHIDGDGWYNITRIDKYKNKFTLSSEVIYDEILKRYDDIPVTVGVIMAEMDKHWNATDEGIEIARKTFALPNVEVASHTYTHPFYWAFFENYDRKKELNAKSKSFLGYKKNNSHADDALTDKGYEVYRAFDKYPFDLHQEIYGGFNILAPIIPKDKKIGLVLWPGDTTPYEKVVKMSRDAGLRNINGGNSRFDNLYPSYAWVTPIGLQVGKERQIFNASCNEDFYTDMWTKNYFAYKYFIQTIYNTNTPIRVKPIDVYYHSYIGERETGLNALKYCLNYIEEQNVTPITTSNYCSIADGFYSTNFVKTDLNTWKISDRDGLQTIRFDNALFKSVDFEKSIGVVGQRHFQCSLYVYLDSAVKEPLLKIKDSDEYWKEPQSNRAYLIQSRWLAWGFKSSNDSFSFSSSGFGSIEMQWQVPKDGKYLIKIGEVFTVESIAKNNILEFNFCPMPKITETVRFVVEYKK